MCVHLSVGSVGNVTTVLLYYCFQKDFRLPLCPGSEQKRPTRRPIQCSGMQTVVLTWQHQERNDELLIRALWPRDVKNDLQSRVLNVVILNVAKVGRF